MSGNYPSGFSTTEQARYFGKPHDSYAERQREADEHEARKEERMNRAADLRKWRNQRKGQDAL